MARPRTRRINLARKTPGFRVGKTRGASGAVMNNLMVPRAAGGGAPVIYEANTANLNRVDQYFGAGNPAELQITGNISVFMRVKADSVSSTDIIASKFSYSDSEKSWDLRQEGSKYKVFVSADGTNTTGVTSSTAPSISVYQDIGFVYNGSTLKLYINGTEEASTSYSSGLFESITGVVIGAYGGVNLGAFPYGGDVAMFRIWDRDLSTVEITERYNAGTPICYSSLSSGLKSGLVYSPRLCNFNGNSGDELVDQSTSGITTTNYNTTPFTGTGLDVECGGTPPVSDNYLFLPNITIY